jgi:hypothetical protein
MAGVSPAGLEPYRAAIVPDTDRPGYLLAIAHTQGVEWLPLPGRTDGHPPTRPDEREFTAAGQALDRALEAITAAGRQERVAVLCVEADEGRCHRQTVLQEVGRRCGLDAADGVCGE